MSSDINERLSAFVDNESQDRQLLDELDRNQALREQLARYHLISDVLHNRYKPGSFDISARVSQALDQEATIITPRRWLRASRMKQHAAGLAVAATVAAVAILFVGDFPMSQKAPQNLAIGPITDKPLQMTSAVQQKLNGYLVSHNEFSVSSKIQGILPYSRIASSAPGQRAIVLTGAGVEK